MADINVKQLSKAIKIDLDNLLAQMKAAGLSHKSEKDIVSTEDKKVLLKFIKDSKKDSKKTISLSTSPQKTAKPNLSVLEKAYAFQKKILIIDDINDSGETFNYIVENFGKEKNRIKRSYSRISRTNEKNAKSKNKRHDTSCYKIRKIRFYD